MSVTDGDPKLTYETMMEFVRSYSDPVVTAGEIAEYFDVSNTAINRRLDNLVERGQLNEKRTGGASKVYWPADA